MCPLDVICASRQDLPTVTLCQILKFRSFEKTFNIMLPRLSTGDSKGGSNFDPKGKSHCLNMSECRSPLTTPCAHPPKCSPTHAATSCRYAQKFSHLMDIGVAIPGQVALNTAASRSSAPHSAGGLSPFPRSQRAQVQSCVDTTWRASAVWCVRR